MKFKMSFVYILGISLFLIVSEIFEFFEFRYLPLYSVFALNRLENSEEEAGVSPKYTKAAENYIGCSKSVLTGKFY